MNKEDIPFLSVAELSAQIKNRSVSPMEATQAYLDRIDSLDFKFNSYLTVARNQALGAAKEAEQAIADGNLLATNKSGTLLLRRDQGDMAVLLDSRRCRL